jgi:TnpA family transposase
LALEHIVHLRALVTETMHWPLSETHLHDMVRGALSISQGKMRASTLLRTLGTPSQKNKLYTAVGALGRGVRTLFLLHFVSDEEMRRTIHAATNTAPAWNGLVQWVACGGEGGMRHNNREAQHKIIRSHHLVANLVVLHNVGAMTQGVQALVDEGYPVTPEILARLAPSQIGHIHRFGTHDLRFDRVPPPGVEALRLIPRPAMHDRGRV